MKQSDSLLLTGEVRCHPIAFDPSCWSVDGNADEGDAIRASATVPSALKHFTAAQAFGNLVDFSKPMRQGSLLSHGQPGLMLLACGRSTTCAVDQILAVFTMDFWGAAALRLKGHASDLTLYSCHVGAEDVGADLVYRLSDLTGATVRACNGYLIVPGDGRIYMENGAVWQEARPGAGRPSSLPSTPRQEFRLSIAEHSKKFVSPGREVQVIEQLSIVSAQYERTLILNSPIATEQLDARQAWEVLLAVETSRIARLAGRPLCASYGTLTLHYLCSESKVSRRAQFALLGDFAQDLETGAYYRMSRTAAAHMSLLKGMSGVSRT